MITEQLIARFLAKVEKTDGCWLWIASCDGTGYGRFGIKGRVWKASRVSWLIANGPIPVGMCVLHRCDNPPCVNPLHLFLGTPADNAADRGAKGRTRVGHLAGEEHGRAKLTRAAVDQIRFLLAEGTVRRTIAARFGVSVSQIRRIKNGQTWRAA